MKTAVACCLIGAFAAHAAESHSPKLEPEAYLSHIRFLASPALKGRGSGTPELNKAAEYIARQFHQAGLQVTDSHNYFQAFSVTTNPRLGKSNTFAWRGPGGKGSLAFQKEFVPFNFSSGGSFEGKLVFAGYGITAKEYNYDDYAGIDVKDKFVIVMRHEPQEFEENSVFSGKVYTEHSQFASKATNAKIHGARGVILVNDIGNHGNETDELEPFVKSVGPSQAGIPFVQVKAEIVDKWLGKSGKSLKSLHLEIDHGLKPQSFDLAESPVVQMHVDIKRESKGVNNVIGVLPGETDEWVVIGAHYDHLGLGEQFSMAPSQAGTPHVGADDNASGTAGVIELARYFGAKGKQHRGIIFMTFAGEELGLLGSSYYVNHPSLPLDKTVAMINMDMIGRIRDHKVYLGGLGTASSFQSLVEGLAKGSPLQFEFSDKTGYGSSDHTSFTTKQVPVLFFFSGLHADYHKPSDTWDKIDAPETVRLLDFVSQTVSHLANDEARPQFVKVAEPPRPLAGSSSGGGYGPYFGSIPDMADNVKGVKFADVRENSPAAKAGLKGGDTMIEFDGKPVGNLMDFTYLLRSKKPGDVVKVKALRGGETLDVDVKLEQRK
ncbi:MAG: M28 family peptidase [Bryobacteraceae bacterium]